MAKHYGIRDFSPDVAQRIDAPIGLVTMYRVR